MPISGGIPVIIDARTIRWDGNEGYIFTNSSNISLHSALPHPISLVDSYVSFDITIPSLYELQQEVRSYGSDGIIIYSDNVNLLCLTGFKIPIIEFLLYLENESEIIMRIRVVGNDSSSHIDLNIGYDETHHFEIILKDYTAEIIMDDETLEFSNNSDKLISIVPVSNQQPYLFIGTHYFTYFMYTLSRIHIETDTFLASADYDINYWLGEFESAYNEE